MIIAPTATVMLALPTFSFLLLRLSLSLAIFGGSGIVLSSFASKGSGAIEAEREHL